ncbi:MAG TPA: LysE family translocator [Propionibacteriaceae bacterium]|nr:LysE family translocator [Propionibacteriaceae bacterium]
MVPSLHALWQFALVVALLTITPGVDTALVLRSAAVAGRARAWGAVLGIGCGVLAWGALTAVGVSALLAASQVAYTVVRLVGAAYLVYLGLRLVWSAFRGHVGEVTVSTGVTDTFGAGWRQGLLTNLLNPKVGAFYLAILPQFIPTEAPHLTWGLSLAAVHVAEGTLWLGTVLLLARSLRAWLERPRVVRGIDAVVGTVIAGFGLRLALD